MGGATQELASRLTTAAVLAAAVVALVVLAPTTVVLVAFAAVIALGAWEWGTLAGLAGRGRMAYAGAIVLAGLVSSLAAPLHLPVLVAGGLWWCVAVIRLGRPPAGTAEGAPAHVVRLVDGALFLLPAWVALVALHGLPGGPGLVLVVLGLCWAADTGAYFGGRRFGRRRLAPRISPGKTVEGLYAGAATAGLVAVVAGILPAGYTVSSLPLWIGICMLATLFSVAGDLFESRTKRAAGAKDSGALLPGHGGILDRVDSVAAAAPVFALAWLLTLGRTAA